MSSPTIPNLPEVTVGVLSEAAKLALALEVVERGARDLIYKLRAEPAQAERQRISRLLGQVANEMFQGGEKVSPSNLLDVISAWLGGWQIHHSHKPIEDLFLAAVALAEAKLAERKDAP